MPLVPAYIVAARRTALGRIGGLHRNRRIDSLTAPVIEAVLADAGVAPDQVDELILGNATEGGNPARLVSLAAGLPECVSALSIDRQCASGLDAILAAIRSVGVGGAEIVVAGGGDSLSTAPWRVARPRNPYQMPHFVHVEASGDAEGGGERQPFAASEALARRLGITRAAQDAWAFAAHQRAAAAQDARAFVGEIVALRANAEEMRDQSATAPDVEELSESVPYLAGDGTLTPTNTSSMHDGAAFVIVASEAAWRGLGSPPALRLVASVAVGVAPHEEAIAPITATRKLLGRNGALNMADIGVIEMSEASAAQALAFADAFHLDASRINPQGGAVVRGHPLGAAGAVLVTRLFTALARGGTTEPRAKLGLATLGALGGIGVAAAFERAQ